MLLQEGQERLRRRLPLKERSQLPQPIGAVRIRRRTRLLQRSAGMAPGQANQSLEHAHAGDAARREHGLRPLPRLRPAIADVLKMDGLVKIRGATLRSL